ncbi:MAG: ABC transporter permease [Desulfovibrio sp.]|nr:MAG: ABC transporter permease [Desulfovibrio sp.]
MNKSLLIARKDLAVMFASPLAFIVLGCFLVITGYFFALHVVAYWDYGLQIMQMGGMTPGFGTSLFVIQPFIDASGLILLFFMPFVTMRGFSEEKRMGTMEVLLSYPLTEIQLVSGKLLGLAGFLVAALALHAVSPALLFLFANPEPLPALTGYLGLFLLGLSFCSLGLFLSSLTERQIISAVLAFASLLLLWLLLIPKMFLPPFWGELLADLSILSHFETFTSGQIVFADLIYYLTFILGFAWLTVLSLENQRWRR